MSRYAQKKVAYRPREQEAPTRFGFVYNEDSINYRTQIPPLPEKPRNKPDEKIKEKKIQDITEKIEKLKETKKKNKELSKKLTAQIDEEYRVEKDKVELGKKCILVLEFDIQKISEQIRRKNGKIKGLQNKVETLISELRELRARNRPAKRVNKKLQEMTNRELDEERNRIELVMSTKSLTKKEQSELNGQLNKIARLKLQENRPIIEEEKADEGHLEKVGQIESEIALLREKEKKIKEQRTKLFETRVNLEQKIEDIREDITQFISKLKEINSRAQDLEQTKKIKEESEKIKEAIKKHEEDIQKIQNDFAEKLKEYEKEQEKIKWISWATKIQEKKREQWQQEKAERKKQKLKEKAVEGKKEQGKNKDDKTGDKEKPAFERKKINKNQKEIDVCSFLIDYCKRLIPSNQKTETTAKKEANPQQDIKNAKWAKGLEVIKSKKAREDEQQQNTKQAYKKKQKNKQEQVQAPSNTFTHEFFVEQYFHSANILPPAKPEELQKIIKDLEDKVDYYINHPDESIEQKFAKDKQFVENTGKNQTNQGKYTKSKGNAKSVINTEDFPAL